MKKEALVNLQSELYIGIWQIHALASVTGCPIQSLVPSKFVTKTLNETLLPRENSQSGDTGAHIMCTIT